MSGESDRTVVTPAGHPPATGYAHAVKTGGLLFVSGQVGMDAHRTVVGPGIEEQTLRALDNVGAVLEAGGATWSQVARLNIYLTEMRQVESMRVVRRGYFEARGLEPPAITTVGVTGLAAEGAIIEIEAIAVLA